MKSLNEYAGVVPAWQVRLATRRIRSWRFRGADFDDALQEVVLALVDHVYDPRRWNGADERQAALTVIERRLAMMRRSDMRYRQRIENWSADQGVTEEVPTAKWILPLDLAGVLTRLPERSRQVCLHLSRGESINEIAMRLHTSWSIVQREITRIRRELQRAGLEPEQSIRRRAVA